MPDEGVRKPPFLALDVATTTPRIAPQPFLPTLRGVRDMEYGEGGGSGGAAALASRLAAAAAAATAATVAA